MSPEYENIIDPLLTNLLSIVQRADQLTIRDLTVELREEFDRANRKMETDREWKYATYAMVAWVDSEIIISHNRWKDETLEAHYFGTGNAYTEFFLRAKRLTKKGISTRLRCFTSVSCSVTTAFTSRPTKP